MTELLPPNPPEEFSVTLKNGKDVTSWKRVSWAVHDDYLKVWTRRGEFEMIKLRNGAHIVSIPSDPS